MAKRRSFVPGCPDGSSLEVRIALSTFGSIGHWFSSQYSHVKEDLGITHKKATSSSAGILHLWQASAKAVKPAHVVHAPVVTANDTVKP